MQCVFTVLSTFSRSLLKRSKIKAPRTLSFGKLAAKSLEPIGKPSFPWQLIKTTLKIDEKPVKLNPSYTHFSELLKYGDCVKYNQLT